jgi:hypothetical protein
MNNDTTENQPAPHRLLIAGQLALLLAVAAAIAAAVVPALERRGLQSEAAYPIQAAQEILATGEWPRTAAYPPMMMIFALAVRAAGVPALDPYAFTLVFLLGGTCAAYALAARVLKHSWAAFAAVLLILINPYFVWTLLLARDAAAEFLFLGLVLSLALALFRPPAGRGAALLTAALLVACMAILSLVRVTGYFMSFGVLAVAWLVADASATRRLLLGCAAALLAFGGAWGLYNYRQLGTFQLATNGGYNLYLGNHPAFLHAYPHYDIDVFLRSQDLTDPGALTEAESSAAYTRAALDYIRADPAAFVYRTLMKSYWFWLGPEKYPNYTSDSRVVSPRSDVEWTAQLTPVSILPGLALLLYRLIYLPAMLASWVALYRKQIDRALVLLYAPLLGLWPVVALTFPDTRFKISAEALTLPVLVAACLALWRMRRKPE